MKCRTCGKEIPETSQVCPFCYATVVKEEVQPAPVVNTDNLNNTSNLTTINTNVINDGTSSNSELNFGDLNNTSLDSNTIQIGERKNKKLPLGIIIIASVVLFVGLFVFALVMLNKPKVYEYQYYTGVVDKIYNYLDENILDSNASNNGTYKIYYTVQGTTKEFKGEYKFDVNKRLLGINGKEKNPEEEKGGVVIGELPTTEFEFALKNNNLYFKSDDIYSSAILLPYEDDIGLLVTKQYEADILLSGVKDAVNASLKKMEYVTTKNVTFEDYGDKTVDKITLTIDYKAKATFLSTFYETLLNDSNFISEYAKIKNRDEEDIERIFKNYKLTYEHKYSLDDGSLSYVNLYHKGKEVVRIEAIDEKENNKLQVDFKNNNLKIKKFEKGDLIESYNITRYDQTMNEKLTRNYNIDYQINGEDYNINIQLDKNENTNNIKVNEIDNAKSIREFNQAELNTLKTNLKPYFNKIDWVDDLQKIFGTKCTKDLKCVCDNTKCTCELNDRIIECPLGTVESTNNPNPTE
ncbi:MAG: hypothetical protein IKP76_04760 [Bacilli bacterium]|nr:hypothetical protein [Bacilli bacterium]